MSSNSAVPRTPSPVERVKPAAPIPIAGRHNRARSDSSATGGYSSSGSSDGSPLRTPPRPVLNMALPPLVAPSAGTSPTSPLFTFLRAGQSPSASTTTTKPAPQMTSYPFGRSATLSALDDDESAPSAGPPVASHARRASLAGTLPSRFPQAAAATAPQAERGAGVLRRLSLGGAFTRPSIVKPPTPPMRTATPPSTTIPEASPMPMATNTAAPSPPRVGRTKRRSATLGGEAARPTPAPRRAPSPMGERMLKGHFDGFN